MLLLPKKLRTHYSRPKRCSQKVLQSRLLYIFPLKMYQYFKYSNSLLFPFDRCRRVASGLLVSEVQAFLQKPSSIIIILTFVNRTLRRINSSRLIGLVFHAVTFLQGTFQPALSASKFLSNLVLSRSNQCFGCGLDQSHCRKLPIQIWLWPGVLAIQN